MKSTLKRGVTLAPYTSYQIGGEAQLFGEPRSLSELVEMLEECDSQELTILGKGSNILVSDSGIGGVVISLREMKSISISGNNLEVDAGASLNRVVTSVVREGLEGMEELAGIPGTVGGAILMNAGAYNSTISDYLKDVTYYDLDSKMVISQERKDLLFTYRESSFSTKRAIILSATFSLKRSQSESLQERVREIQSKRVNSQPLQYPSCGSVFKRPPNNYAGALIEQAGLKGKRIGGAQISEKHANFIVNLGDAKAEDIFSLINLARESVYRNSGILLEPEVRFFGNFTSKLWEPQ